RSWLARAAHDLSDGGLVQSLTEAVLRYGIGEEVNFEGVLSRDGVDVVTVLFDESVSRVMVAVDADRVEVLTELAVRHQVPLRRLWASGGDSLVVAGAFEIGLAELAEAHEGTLPSIFG